MNEICKLSKNNSSEYDIIINTPGIFDSLCKIVNDK